MNLLKLTFSNVCKKPKEGKELMRFLLALQDDFVDGEYYYEYERAGSSDYFTYGLMIFVTLLFVFFIVWLMRASSKGAKFQKRCTELAEKSLESNNELIELTKENSRLIFELNQSVKSLDQSLRNSNEDKT